MKISIITYWFYWSLLALILSSSGVYAHLEMTEVMYAPSSELGGSSNEWVEIYNFDNETQNLSSCFFNSQKIEGTMDNYSYIVLVRDKDLFLDVYSNFSPHWLEVSFGRGLSNEGSSLNLTCAGWSEIVPYDGSLAKNNNKTLEKNLLGEWKESLAWGGTPGRINSIYSYSYDYSALQITEILPDPVGNDDASKPLGEWVELYNSGKDPVLLKGLVLYDDHDDDELKITDTNTKGLELCSGCYAVVYRDGDSDFALNDELMDKVRLYTGYPLAENTLLDEMSFAYSVEGMSWSTFSEGWFLTIPTPEKENVYTSGCDWEIKLETNSSIFKGNEAGFAITVEREYGLPEYITVKGTIETIFGEIIKTYSPWTNHTVSTRVQQAYTPNLPEGIYQVKFKLENLSCTDSYLGNNDASLLLAINPQYQELGSSLGVERLYLGSDDTAQWGDQFTVKVNIYKGNSTQTAIELWAEKSGKTVSERSKLNIYEQYQPYTLTLPVQLHSNCAHEETEDGEVKLVLEGLGLRSEKIFTIKGVDEDICQDYEKYVQEQEDNKKAAISSEIVSLPSSVDSGGVIPLGVQIINEEKEHTYQVWAYLYKGNKCYSCQNNNLEREANLQKVKVRSGEVKRIDFLLRADELEEGEYAIKVNIIKDDQKTAKELHKTIYLLKLGSQQESIASNTLTAAADFRDDFGLVAQRKLVPQEGLIVYESNSQKATNLIPYFLLICFILVIVVVLKNRSNTS